MYGLEDVDFVVKYYDDAFGISGENETSWYLDKVKELGEPVLDLACGTGRLALLFGREGYEVTAIDRSKGMINQFKKKLIQEVVEIQQKIRIDTQNMADFHLDRKFKTVVCCDAFFHNLRVEDQMNCLKRVAQHLKSGGHFLFNLPNPTCKFILESSNTREDQFMERGRYPLENMDETLLVEQANTADVLNQIIVTKLRFTRFNKVGQIMEEAESSWKTRYLFKYEAVHLLCRCGFRINQLVGDYLNGPVTDGGQLIFDVTPNDVF